MITGPHGSATFSTQNGEPVGQLIQQVNGAGIGVTAAVTSSGRLRLSTNEAGSNEVVTVSQANGSDITNTLGLAAGSSGAGTNARAAVNGVAQTGQGNSFTVIGAGSLTGLQFTAAATGTTTVRVTPSAARKFQVGANANQTIQGRLHASTTEQLGVGNIDVTTQAGAERAITQLDQAIQSTSSQLAQIGGQENRLLSAENNAATAQGNALSARSLVADTSIAQASTNLVNSLVLQHFSLFALQQQANSFALQSALLV